MAKYTTHFQGNFKEVIECLKQEIMAGSFTASLEEESYINLNGVDCAVLVFERYSYTGSNRVSLNITILADHKEVYIIGISAGGSQGMIFKFNTFGEEAFLEKLQEAIEKYINKTSY